MIKKTTGAEKLTPAADYTEKEGYGVTIAAGVATLSASATTPIDGIIITGGTVAQGVDVAILGNFTGQIAVKLSGTVAQNAKIVQHTDGTFITDPGTGSRVVIGLTAEAGVEDDLVGAYPRTPLVAS